MVQVVIDDIQAAFEQYTPHAMLSGIIIIILLFIIALFRINFLKNHSGVLRPHRFLLYYIFYVYVFMVVSITLLSRPTGSREGVNLEFLGTLTHSIDGDRYLVENIILFIPLGFMLPLLWRRLYAVYWSILIGLIGSISIEICQHVTKRGYLQLDDIILNVSGTVIGFIIIFIIHKIAGLFESK